MGYRFFLYFFLVLLLASCKKGPQIIHKVLDIKAGDSTSPGVHYVKINKSIQNGHFADFYFQFSGANDLFIDNTFTWENPVTSIWIFSINPVNPLNSEFICVDPKGFPVQLPFGDLISDTLRWTNKSNNVIWEEAHSGMPNGYDDLYGNWQHSTEGFLGFKVVGKTMTYKGWIRIGLYYVKDYAYVEY
jgi:hypothetical protein